MPSIHSADLLDAYHVSFFSTLHHLMIIGAVIAFVGSVGAFALVRQGDLIVPAGQGAGHA